MLIVAAPWLIVVVVLPNTWGHAMIIIITANDAQNTKPRNHPKPFGSGFSKVAAGSLLIILIHVIFQPHRIDNTKGTSQ